ncbi:MAG TPA: DNA polymerase III subunit beta [Cyanobacteria bacterium UBA11369]|nr:DNA polymerase III subunit beta [Cyanobacteria bacterium UBA11371]HBE31311.1 DNA polymerase III subunit beta [Cyanobacteria bacterium UBA11368]HBE53316.1 DNA polymerase III subunit beta [Cyanobacteria bacterium UBA11369]
MTKPKFKKTVTVEADADSIVASKKKRPSTTKTKAVTEEKVNRDKAASSLTNESETVAPDKAEQIPESLTPTDSTGAEVEIICNSREFNDYIQALKTIIPNNSTHPILCNVLIEADAAVQQLYLTTYNLEFGLQVGFDATVNQPGKLTLPAPILADILGKFPSGRLTLNSQLTTSKGNETSSVTATMKMSGSHHVLRGLLSDEFPAIPNVEQKLLSLPASVLLAALKGSLFAVSSDEVKRIITGAYFQLSHDSDRRIDQLRIWTTDGHRIAMILGLSESTADPNPLIDSPVQFTVPAKVLKVLERNVNPTDRISIYYNASAQAPQNFVAFKWKNWRLTSQLLEGQYPNCNQIIDPFRSQFSHQLLIERLSLLKALERLSTHSDKSHVTVILDFDSTHQQVQASINNAISSGIEVIDAQINGGDFRIKCDIRYLIDTIKAISNSDVRMLFATPTTPILIVPFGTPASGEAAIESEYVIAPQE